jgi:glutamate synthase (ferredoxin)
MLQSDALKAYYKDLSDKDFETLFAIYHRRFSTNTMPRWSLA